jgi:dolichol-phosphate mannosyltransferase
LNGFSVVAVVPTYNERDNIENLAGQIFSTVPAIEVLVVDDMSPDGTADVVRSLQPRFPRLRLLYRTEDRGFGPAYLAGFREVMQNPDIDAILMMDADLSHNPAHIPAMLERIATCDAVIGSRYTANGGVSGWELWRRILSKAGNRYVRAVTGMPFRDCTSGFNLIRTDLLRRLDLTGIGSSGYAFLMELKHLMWRSGANIQEVPIIFLNRAGGESKLSGHIVTEGIKAPWLVRFGKKP